MTDEFRVDATVISKIYLKYILILSVKPCVLIPLPPSGNFRIT